MTSASPVASDVAGARWVKRPRRAKLARAGLVRTALILAFGVVWELAAGVGVLDQEVTSSPAGVVKAAASMVGEASFWNAMGQTGRSILLAFLIGSAIGIVVGVALGLSRLLGDAYMTPLLFLMSTPKSIFLPVFILLYGIGGASAVAFGAFEASVFVAVNIAAGMHLVEDKHLRMARAFAASRRQRLALVVLPAALPSLFTALWFGIKHAFTGVMIAELWASSAGVGALIRLYADRAQTDRVFALIISITALAVIAGTTWNRAELRLTRWRTDSKDSGDLLSRS